MKRILLLSSVRHLTRHPVLSALSVLGIAIGVAVVVAIDLSNESARQAFALSAKEVSGRTTHQVLGGPSGIDEAVYVRLRRELPATAMAPVVEGYVTSPADPGRAILALGVDPFAEGPFRSYSGVAGSADLTAFLTKPATGVVTAATRAKLAAGGKLPLSISGVRKEVAIVGELPASTASSRALDDLLVTDIATAQELLHQEGRLSRIDLALPDSPEGQSAKGGVERICGGQCDVVTAASRALAITQMTRAFDLNLSALSLLALVVGTFLIYNTMTFSVVQRRSVLGTLRAMGVTRGEVFAMVAREALILALPATALGLGLGALLASELVRLVTRTINDLYFVVNVRALSLDTTTLIKGVALGVGATVVAGLAPAWEATRVPPTVTMRRSSSETALMRRAPRLALAGAALVALSSASLALSGRSLAVGYVGLFAVMLGAALTTPLAARAFADGVRPLLGRVFGPLGRMAARGIVTSLTRTSVALAALVMAVATTVGVGIMVRSFRDTVSNWLATSLQSDIFVQPPSLVSRKGDGTLRPDVVRRVAATPGVAAVNTIRNRRVRTDRGDVDLHVPSFGAPRARPYRFRSQAVPDVLRVLESEDAIAVTEPYAFHQELALGTSVSITTDHGVVPFRVIGIYADYASDQGGILMSRAVYERYFDDRGISGLAVVAEPGVDLGDLRERIKESAGPEQALTIRVNRELREASLAIFDRTFAITQVLRLVSIGVAFVGILSALMALSLERARELAVLRAIGMTPRELVRLVTLQTSLMGVCAGILSVPLGIALALILVFVINRRSFGWTLDLVLSGRPVAEALLLSVVAALLAGLYPSWKMSRARPASALREE